MEEASSHNITIDIDVEGHVDGSNINSELAEPTVGMEFPTEEDIKTFYQTYASRKGFGWKIRNLKRGLDGKLYYLVLACSREGTRVSKIPPTLKTLPTCAAKCDAKITAGKTEKGQWRIKKVVLKHSHDLSPTKARKFRMNKSISMHGKRAINVNDDAGVRISKTFQSLAQAAGGYENLTFDERDVRNYIQKERRAIGKEGDAKALLNYFHRMKEMNSNFVNDIDVDDEFQVRSVFWADARSRATYESFGDVVTFDTTYLTNKYEMPFAAFVGINHHGQTCLLGCGLLSSEDTESFVWLFECWVRCMNGKPPSAIVTDQCKAMRKEIEIVMPSTRHRWCLWHIMKKIPEKLSSYGAYQKIKSALKVAVYETLTEEEFDDKWCSLLKEFELETNEWLCGLYKDRHRWIPIFMKKDFWAGMSTTQRSESIHAFFYGYVNSKTSLQQFVKQYDNALRSRAEKEFEADFQSMNTIVHCGSNSTIEKQFQLEYTHAKFSEVQNEFREKMNCGACLSSVEGVVASYNVLKEIIVNDRPRDATYKVTLNRENYDISCQCLLFEFRGIVCRHSLCVLTLERVKELPCKYILPRWSKRIKWKHSYIRTSYDVAELKPRMERFDKLCKSFYEVAEQVADSDDATNLLHATLDGFKSKLESMPSLVGNVNLTSIGENVANKPANNCQNQVNEIRSPLRVARKGRPPSKRKMSQVEKIIQKGRKKATKRVQHEVIKESVAMDIGQEGGSNLRIQSSFESMGVCLQQNVAVSSFEENFLNTQFANVQPDNIVSLLNSMDYEGFSYTHLLSNDGPTLTMDIGGPNPSIGGS